MKYIRYYQSPIGRLALGEEDGCLTKVYFDKETVPEDFILKDTPLLIEAQAQLEAYFEGSLKVFTIPLHPEGTPFFKKVWDTLVNVPFGVTATYKDIASLVGNPKATRAVGLANNRNPIPLFIPCHRIVGSSGKLTGYRGGLEAKAHLIKLEKVKL